MKLGVAAIAFLFTLLRYAQPGQWFPPGQMMTIRVYYYPAAWSEPQWERDFQHQELD